MKCVEFTVPSNPSANVLITVLNAHAGVNGRNADRYIEKLTSIDGTKECVLIRDLEENHVGTILGKTLVDYNSDEYINVGI